VVAIATIEAMKTEAAITASTAGTIDRVAVAETAPVEGAIYASALDR
jgi:pyruvate carboxylase